MGLDLNNCLYELENACTYIGDGESDFENFPPRTSAAAFCDTSPFPLGVDFLVGRPATEGTKQENPMVKVAILKPWIYTYIALHGEGC